MNYQALTRDRVLTHNNISDCWIIIDNKVFDITKFLKNHPGGSKILLDVAGRDVTIQFQKYHRWSLLKKYIPSLQIGIVQTNKSEKIVRHAFSSKAFGELIPYGDPSWYQDWHSPYYKD